MFRETRWPSQGHTAIRGRVEFQAFKSDKNFLELYVTSQLTLNTPSIILLNNSSDGVTAIANIHRLCTVHQHRAQWATFNIL